MPGAALAVVVSATVKVKTAGCDSKYPVASPTATIVYVQTGMSSAAAESLSPPSAPSVSDSRRRRAGGSPPDSCWPGQITGRFNWQTSLEPHSEASPPFTVKTIADSANGTDKTTGTVPPLPASADPDGGWHSGLGARWMTVYLTVTTSLSCSRDGR